MIADNGAAEDADVSRGSIVRLAKPEDLGQIVALMHQHAAYEKADPLAADLGDRLAPLLFGGAQPARIGCFVGVSETGAVLGYATVTVDLSSWHASEFLYLDCLFVTEEARGRGTGAQLMEAISMYAASRGMGAIQWQTPDWNAGAIRFYDRWGATRTAKQRYTYKVSASVL